MLHTNHQYFYKNFSSAVALQVVVQVVPLVGVVQVEPVVDVDRVGRGPDPAPPHPVVHDLLDEALAVAVASVCEVISMFTCRKFDKLRFSVFS